VKRTNHCGPTSRPNRPAAIRLVAALILLGASGSEAPAQTYEGFTEPVRSIEVAAGDTGRIVETYVARGDHVSRGDLLMVLDQSVLEASRKVTEARAAAAARVQALEVERELQEGRYRKLLELQQEGAGSTEEVNRARADAEVARLKVEAAREELDISRLELEEIAARIERRRVRSPIDGIVTDVLKELGEYVSANDPHVATVVQLDTLRVTFYLPTELAMPLARGANIPLRFPELRRTTTGRVEYVSPVTEADSGRARVDVIVANSGGTIRSGIRCETEFGRAATAAPHARPVSGDVRTYPKRATGF
jgi:RND family efflux transporter MFP subunit